MPVGNMPTFRSQTALQPARWAFPLIRLGGVQIHSSYGVLITAIALPLFAFTLASSPGNAEMPRVVGLGVLFWLSGWMVQSVTYLSISRLTGSPAADLCVGVLGVELGPRRWPAQRALLVSLATMASMIVLGSVYRLIEGGLGDPPITRSDQSMWSAPSIGFAEHDSIWQSAAWLCWAQAVLQLYPLPRTIGRQLIGALTSISASRLPLPLQVAIFRRGLGMIALLTIGVAIASVVTGTSFFGVRWIFFLVLALILWISSQGIELGLILAGLGAPAAEGSTDRLERNASAPLDLVAAISDSCLHWRSRRRLRSAQRREQGEAIDVSRVDEILTRLHQEGMESLSPDDRRILDRVSESLRRQRRDGSITDPPAD